MCLGSNGVDKVVCCENVRHDFVGQTFFTYCTSSAQIAPSFAKKRNDPKCTQTLRNSQKHEFWVQWGGIGAFVAKMYNTTSWHELCSLIAPVRSNCTEFRTVTKRSQMHPNTTKLTKKLLYCPMGWTRCVRYKNVSHEFVAQTFLSNYTNSAQIAPSFAK